MKVDKDKYASLLKALGKRPRTVLEKILENGSVSTYELGQLGYDQPPRAAQDLKEAGVKLRTSFGKHPTTGARMAIYSLAQKEPDSLPNFVGRTAFPIRFRTELFRIFNNRCNICNSRYNQLLLQIDHRIPYIISGESDQLIIDDFQPLCGSHQRLKSWTCEHCSNRENGDRAVCATCYWAIPDGEYQHIATVPERRLDITWKGLSELEEFATLTESARKSSSDIQTLVKTIIKKSLKKPS